MSTSSLVQRSLGPPCPGPAMAAVRVVAGGRGSSYTSCYREHDRRMLPGTVIGDDTTIGSILSGCFCVVFTNYAFMKYKYIMQIDSLVI